jgi:hypothetical protein
MRDKLVIMNPIWLKMKLWQKMRLLTPKFLFLKLKYYLLKINDRKFPKLNRDRHSSPINLIAYFPLQTAIALYHLQT